MRLTFAFSEPPRPSLPFSSPASKPLTAKSEQSEAPGSKSESEVKTKLKDMKVEEETESDLLRDRRRSGPSAQAAAWLAEVSHTEHHRAASGAKYKSRLESGQGGEAEPNGEGTDETARKKQDQPTCRSTWCPDARPKTLQKYVGKNTTSCSEAGGGGGGGLGQDASCLLMSVRENSIKNKK